jgi:hypothetical protein
MRPKSLKSKNFPASAVLLGAAICAVSFTGQAQSFLINNTTADAFLASGAPGNPSGTDLTTNNYGGAGTLAVSPAGSTKGEFDSVIMFNTAAAISSFNTTYGIGNWTITGLTLSLASNTGTQGAVPGNTIFNTVSAGAFEINWLSNDSWVEGGGNPASPSPTGVNFNSIPSLLAGSDALGAFSYAPPGNNVYANYTLPLDGNLVSDAAAGGNVSLYLYATNGAVGYLFNSRTFASGHPELTINVTPAPEPATISLMALSFGGALLLRARKQQS